MRAGRGRCCWRAPASSTEDVLEDTGNVPGTHPGAHPRIQLLLALRRKWEHQDLPFPRCVICASKEKRKEKYMKGLDFSFTGIKAERGIVLLINN